MNKLSPIAVVAVLLLLGACAGTGVRDNSVYLKDASGGETLVFVNRADGFGAAALMFVEINGVRAGELGVWETVSAKAEVGANSLVVGYTGFSGAFRKPHKRTFNMKAGQKRFLTLRDKEVGRLGSLEIQSREITKDEFFKDVKRRSPE